MVLDYDTRPTQVESNEIQYSTHLNYPSPYSTHIMSYKILNDDDDEHFPMYILSPST